MSCRSNQLDWPGISWSGTAAPLARNCNQENATRPGFACRRPECTEITQRWLLMPRRWCFWKAKRATCLHDSPRPEFSAGFPHDHLDRAGLPNRRPASPAAVLVAQVRDHFGLAHLQAAILRLPGVDGVMARAMFPSPVTASTLSCGSRAKSGA